MRPRLIVLVAAFAVFAAACGAAETTEATAQAGSSETTAAPSSESTAPTSESSSGSETAPPAAAAGPPAPDFDLTLGDGSAFRLSSHAQPVYLVFWAEW